MNVAIQIAISLVTVVMSMTGAAFISGTRWGRVEADIRAMSARLARIEGMFVLRLKDGEHDQPG